MIVLPTARAVSARLLLQKDINNLLEQHITIGELFSRLIRLNGRRLAQNNERIILMQRASKFSGFEKLQIERNFFTFIKNSEYVFRFFEELGGEERTINNLLDADTYAEYEEHLLILAQLRENYLKECNAHNLSDKMFLSEHYTLNESYAKSLKELKVSIEGYLTRFELRILKELSTFSTVLLEFFARDNNLKMQKTLKELGFELLCGYDYVLNLTTKKIISSIKITSQSDVTLYSFSERIAQVGFVKKMIYDFVKSEIAPQNIAIIVPDENFAEVLSSFDELKNINLAMGHSLKTSTYVRMLDAISLVLSEPNLANNARAEKYEKELQILRPLWNKKVEINDFISICKELVEIEKKVTTKDILLQSLYNFEKLKTILKSATFRELMQMFLNDLNSKSLDDVGGGHITVMGVLESRAMQYDGVIVLDFNDTFVPKQSTKEMFLNTKVRHFSGLPDQRDRNDLQKYYFERLFEQAKKVAISYVQDEQSSPSRFIYDMRIGKRAKIIQKNYLNLLFTPHEKRQRIQKQIIKKFNFKEQSLSSTSLKTFLTCKRKFYHRYVQKLKTHQIETPLPNESEVGIWLHDALRNLYNKKNSYSSKEVLKSDFFKELDSLLGKTQMHKYLRDIWMQRLEPFFTLEIERFSKNIKVAECETSMKIVVHGIELYGIIDRIDETKNGYELLDYKSGNFTLYTERTVEKATDFQLQFYFLLASQKYDINSAGFYSLKNSNITPEIMMDKKLQMLDSILKTLSEQNEINFKKCESLASCRFCDYVHLCDRS